MCEVGSFREVVRFTSEYSSPQACRVDEARVSVDFCVSVSQKFPPAVQVMAAYKLVQYLMELPEEKPTSESGGGASGSGGGASG